MSYPDLVEPPAKKRRFFVEDSPIEDSTFYPKPALPDELNPLPGSLQSARMRDASTDGAQLSSSQTDISTLRNHEVPDKKDDAFNQELFESFIGGAVSEDILQTLWKVAGGDMERAINLYLDGSWKNEPIQPPSKRPSSDTVRPRTESAEIMRRSKSAQSARSLSSSSVRPKRLEVMPSRRYVGAFGVGAWATRSGTNLVGHGEVVSIERTKSKPPTKLGRGGKVVQVLRTNVLRQRADVIVRFTNAKGEEVGRLPKETATWVSSLIDQNVCYFEGLCVLAPDKIRINDTIYLQLRCFLLRKAFEEGGFTKPEDNNRTTGFFEEKETSEEKELRMRQVALVKLFDEINLHPSIVNETTAKDKRQGILEAAEIAEQYDEEGDKKKPQNLENDVSTTSGEDEPEEGKELEQDQLDTLYKKAQSFDFNTPTREPADTFVMSLRKYQKQALHWMMSKEKDEKAVGQDLSMHPLWEEYTWPVKDVDDKELPVVQNQDSFYVNPYSGELSLDFPVQEQHCLGGILADGTYILARLL